MCGANLATTSPWRSSRRFIPTIPTIGATDVLVRVHAASVNPVDIKTRDGKLKTLLKYRFPLVLGNDLSGVVSEVGSRVTRFKKGDAVYARPL